MVFFVLGLMSSLSLAAQAADSHQLMSTKMILSQGIFFDKWPSSSSEPLLFLNDGERVSPTPGKFATVPVQSADPSQNITTANVQELGGEIDQSGGIMFVLLGVAALILTLLSSFVISRLLSCRTTDHSGDYRCPPGRRWYPYGSITPRGSEGLSHNDLVISRSPPCPHCQNQDAQPGRGAQGDQMI